MENGGWKGVGLESVEGERRGPRLPGPVIPSSLNPINPKP